MTEARELVQSQGHPKEAMKWGVDRGSSTRTSKWCRCLFKGTSWMLLSVAGLLWLSTELELQALQQVELGGFLRAWFMARWAFILGLVGLAVLLVWLIIRAMTKCRALTAR